MNSFFTKLGHKIFTAFVAVMLVAALPMQVAHARPLAATVQFAMPLNADVVINRTGGVTDTTQVGVDGDAAASMCYLTQTAAANYSGNPNGIPDNGLIAANAFHPAVQLAVNNTDNRNNAQKITPTGSLTFTINVPDDKYSYMHIFGVTGNGASSFSLTFNYSDATSTTTSTVNLRDWFDDFTQTATEYYLIDGLDRMGCNVTGYQNSNDPAIFGHRFAPNVNKTLQTVTVTVSNLTGGERAIFFGAVGESAPTVTINQGAGQLDPTTASPITFDVVFSETVTGFIGSDVNLSGSTTPGTLTANVIGNGTNYTVSVSGMTGAGNVIAIIPANAAQNGSGIGNSTSTSTDNQVTFNINVAPTVTTQAVTAITATTATGNGNITALGVPNPTQYGVVWDTAINPTVALATKTTQGVPPGVGAFTSPITGLTPNTLYHVRAYATNTAGTSYGADVTFMTGVSAPTATTNPASAVTATGATLNGTVNANNESTTVTFEYGETTAYGTTVTAAPSPVTGITNTAVSAAITGLTSGTTYHFRVVAQNGTGITNGLDATFMASSVTVTTAIHDASDTPITSAYFGQVVHDSAAVAGTGVTPTGDVTFTVYNNNNCSGTGSAAGTVALVAGVADPSSTATVTTSGISYRAAYNGDANYNSATSTCETLNLPPQVAIDGVNTDPNTGDGVLTEFEVVTVGATQFTVTFDQDVIHVASGDPSYGDSALNPANYMLVRDLGDTADFQTVNCLGGVVTPADTQITVDSVSYNTGTHVATFTINGGLPLSNGNYRLYICGTKSIRNLSGVALGFDGTTGADFVRNFIVSISGGRGGNNNGGSGGGGGNKSNTNRTISGLSIPVTGFAPGRVTLLPIQPAEKAYKPLDEIRIEIPTLGINFPIVGVSLTKNNWDLTWLSGKVGYLEGSAYPTFSGNTVLTGHVLDANNNLGPFSDIKGMRLGDKIYLHAYGQVYVYQVQENRKLSPTNTATVFKHQEYNWVTLVTCEDYNTKTETYNYRRMVRAVLVSVIPEK